MKNKIIECDNQCGRECEIRLCQPCYDEILEKEFMEGRESIVSE